KFALVIHVLERTRQERNVPAFEKGFYPRIFLDSSPSQGGKLLEKDRSQGRRVAASSLEPCHPDTVSHQNVIQQTVNTAERAGALLPVLRIIQSGAGFVKVFIGDAVVAGQHSKIGWKIHYFAAPCAMSFLMIFLPFITNFTRCSSVISDSGSPETAIRSAYLPLSMDPIWSCHPRASALIMVPLRMALAGVKPARFTSHSKSRAWVPCG